MVSDSTFPTSLDNFDDGVITQREGPTLASAMNNVQSTMGVTGSHPWLTATLPAVLNGAALPTADPHVAGHIWANSGVLTVSAG